MASTEFAGNDRFEVRRRIGAGSAGIVYEVRDRERDSHVALKTLARLDAGALYRFKKEFRALADVSHDNLVHLHELVSIGDEWFFTMELVKGVDFIEWVRPKVRALGVTTTADLTDGLSEPFGPTMIDEKADEVPPVTHPPSSRTQRVLDIAKLRAALGQLAQGVAALHDAGMLHRDIKPTNILVADRGRVVLLDFGIVTELAAQNALSTDVNDVVGTPAYMAPEQGAGLPLGTPSDWYAVGVVLYEALTGRLPFVGTSMQVMMDKQRLEPPRPSEIVRGVPQDLDALCVELLRIRPEARPSGREVLRRLGVVSISSAGARVSQQSATSTHGSLPTTQTPFVGRAAALTTLNEAFGRTRKGPVAVFVHGRSGMGKSALVRHFLDGVIAREEAVVLAGRCYERESVPYKAFDSIIDALTRHLMQLPRAAAAAVMPRDAAILARVFPVMARVSAIAEAPRRAIEITDSQALRIRAFAALREMLARLADRKPLIVFIDDLQWGDADSAALLVSLTTPPDPPSMLILLGYRTEDAATSPMLRALLERRMAHLASEATTINLEALLAEDAELLASSLLGDDPGGTMAATIAHEAAGNPFFITELVRYVQSDASNISSTGLRLEKVLHDRILALAEHPMRLLQVVAIAGRPIRREVAYRAAEISIAERTQALSVLRVGHLVRTAGTRSAEQIEPYHDRIREAVTALLEPAELRALHAQVADALTEAGDADPESLFFHFHAAEMRERAATHAEAAAAKATRALAFDRATQFYRTALELLPADAPAARPMRAALGDALANAGRGAHAAEAYLAATAGANAADQLELRRRAAEQLLMSGRIDQGLQVIEAVLAQVKMRLAPSPQRALVAFVFLRLWIWLRGLGFEERDATAVAAKDLTRIDVCWSVAAGLGVVDNIRAAHFQTWHLLFCLAAGEPMRLCRALSIEASFSAVRGKRGEKRSAMMLDTARQLALRQPRPENEALVAAAASMSAFFTGRWKSAHENAEKCIAIYRDNCTGSRWELDTAQYFGLCALLYLGDLVELGKRIPAHLREARERGDLYLGTNILVGDTNTWALIEDDPATAREMVNEGMGHWSRRWFHVQHWYEIHALCQTDLYEGNAASAHERIQSRWRAITAAHMFRIEHSRVKAHGLRGRSALALAEMGIERARNLALAERDARAMLTARMPYVDAIAALLRAGVSAARGDEAGAVTELEKAVVISDGSDMALYAAVARRRLGQLVKGDRGRDLLEASTQWMITRGVKNPDRLCTLYAPGFSDR